jgi:DNA-binding transcriptional MerR regulator
MTTPTTDAVRSPTAGRGPGRTTGSRRGRGEAGEGTWSIAQIADEFGVTHRTVRHYEDLGLISPERRGTTRVYHRRDRTRLGLILRGRRLGFPLDEIRTIIDLYDVPRGRRSQLEYVLAQIGERRTDLEQRRRDLESALAELADFERRCREDLDGLDGLDDPAERGPST